MRVTRSASLGVLVGIAVPWAACWVIGGLWLVFDLSRVIPVAGRVVVTAGIGAIAAGQFLFLVTVADKLLPRVARRVEVWAMEMALFAVFSACFGWAAVTVVWSVMP
ncbi:MAG: hypothetical protein ACKVU4_10670 [Phycisphaerales bacterium]